MRTKNILSYLVIMLAVLVLALPSAFARSVSRHSAAKRRAIVESAHVQKRMASGHHSRRTARVVRTSRVTRLSSRHHRYYEHFTGNSFAEDLTSGDVTTGEDPIVR